MKEGLFAISEYCLVHKVDPSFISSLESEGLIRIVITEQEKFVEEEQLRDLEVFTRWHQELGINIEGIDAISSLLDRFRQVQAELHDLRFRLSRYEQP